MLSRLVKRANTGSLQSSGAYASECVCHTESTTTRANISFPLADIAKGSARSDRGNRTHDGHERSLDVLLDILMPEY